MANPLFVRLFLRLIRGAGWAWALALAAGPGWAVPGAVAGPLRVAYVEMPPFTYTDSRGEPEGSLIGMLGKVAELADFSLSFQSLPPVRLFQAVADGRYDLFMGVTTPTEFVGTTLIGESDLARIELNAYALDVAPAVKTKEDLAGSTIIVHRGYSYGGLRPYLEDPANRITRIEAETPEQALSLLRSRRAPLLLEYALSMKMALAGRFIPNLKMTPLSQVPIRFVVSRKMADPAGALARLESGFQKLRDAGALP